MKKKILATLALTCAFSAGLGTLAACDKPEPEVPPLEFVGGYVDEIEFGESLLLSDYVDTSVEGYTLVATKGDKSIALTGKATWNPDDVGEWTLTYTVGEQSVQATITVKAPPISWTYSANPQIFVVGDTLEFATVLTGLNIAVESTFEYEVFIESVLIGENRTNLKGQTSFTFAEAEIHYFTFTVESEDGQKLSAQFDATPYDETKGPMDWLESDVKTMMTTFGTSKSVNVNPDYVKEGKTSMGFGSARDATAIGIGMGINHADLKAAFEDPTVAAVTVEVYLKVANPTGTYTYQLWSYDNDAEKIEFNPNEWTTLTFTKEDYAYYVAGKGNGTGTYYTAEFTTSFKIYGNIAFDSQGLSDCFYLDDFSTVKGEVSEDEDEVKDFLEIADGAYYGTYGGSQLTENTDAGFIKEGEKSIKVTAGRNDARGFGYLVKKTQIDAIFADESVTAITFDIYLDVATPSGEYSYELYQYDAAAEKVALTVKQWTTITITRETYENYKDGSESSFYSGDVGFDLMIFGTVVVGTDCVYMDNIQVVKG